METVYIDTNTQNTIVLKSENDAGVLVTTEAAAALAVTTRITLRIGDTLLDSTLTPTFFDWSVGGGKILLSLGGAGITPGYYAGCEIVTYDPSNVAGIQWGAGLDFKFVDETLLTSSLDVTEGGESANSYATVIEADTLLNSEYETDEWESLSLRNKQKLLLTATRAIESMPMMFEKAESTQALKFPVYESAELPSSGYQDAKLACIWQAWWIYRMSDSLREADSYLPMGIRTEQVGPLKAVRVGYNPMAKWSPDALRILSKYTDFNFVIRRG